jgi:hypothetical protein
MANFQNDMTRYQFSFYLFKATQMWSRNCFCSFCHVDLIFACFYLTGQLKLILQKFQLAGVVLVVSNPHVFNLTGQLESKPLEFSYFSCDRSHHPSLTIETILLLMKGCQEAMHPVPIIVLFNLMFDHSDK